MKTSRIYYYIDVPYVARHSTAPASFKDPVMCSHCGRTWDDSVSTGITPAPSGRCPFEYWHKA